MRPKCYLLCGAARAVRWEGTVRRPRPVRLPGAEVAGTPSSRRPWRHPASTPRDEQLSRRGRGEVCRRCYWEVRPCAWPHLLPLGPCPGRRLHQVAPSFYRPPGTAGVGGTVRSMDLTYPPEAEEFRGVIRAWLTENLPEGWGTPGFSMTAGRAHRLQRGVDGETLRRRVDLRQLAHRIRRQGADPPPAGRAERGVRPGRRTAARRLLR